MRRIQKFYQNLFSSNISQWKVHFHFTMWISQSEFALVLNTCSMDLAEICMNALGKVVRFCSIQQNVKRTRFHVQKSEMKNKVKNEIPKVKNYWNVNLVLFLKSTQKGTLDHQIWCFNDQNCSKTRCFNRREAKEGPLKFGLKNVVFSSFSL